MRYASFIIMMLMLVIPACSGQLCTEDESTCIGYGGTGGPESVLLPCAIVDGARVCMDASEDHPAVQAALAAHEFVLDGIDEPCVDPSEPWNALADYAPTDTPVQVFACNGAGPPRRNSTVCHPGPEVWGDSGALGAVAMWWINGNPDCEGINPPYDYAHQYWLRIECAGEINCGGLTTRCGCSCGTGFNDYCDDTQDGAQVYFQDDLIESGWESSCTGFPWTWNGYQAQWEGSTCEWNQAGPNDDERGPQRLDALRELLGY